jgi:NADPH2:quinone reductase
VKPIVAERLPLAEARRAQEMLAKGGVVGKIVLMGGRRKLERLAA